MTSELDKYLREQAMFSYRADIAPVLADLMRVGVKVKSLQDLLSDRRQYRLALPILLDWFQKTDSPSVKDEIARTLSSRWAKPLAASVLIEEFKHVHDKEGLGLRWTIGNALFTVADDSVFEQIAGLAQDARFGRAREMVTLALGKMKNQRAVEVLIRLLGDDDVLAHAIRALGKMRAPQARAPLTSFLRHERALVRREARRALAKIG